MGELSTVISHNITTGMLVWGVCIGAILAFTVYFFQTRILGSLIRALLKDAQGEDNAKALDELGKNKAFYRFFLRDKSTLRKYVSVIGGSVPKNADGVADFASARFYISEEKSEIAEKRYSRETKIWVYVLAVVALLLIGLIMFIAMPYLLEYVKG